MVGAEFKLGDCRNWREAEYKTALRAERIAKSRTVFSAIFTPCKSSSPEMVATASSDGRVAVYSIEPPGCSQLKKVDESELQLQCPASSEPLITLGKHDGPAYDLLLYGEGENSLLLSCGDDGRIQGWRWDQVSERLRAGEKSGDPVVDLKNPQQKGPRSALSPIPETNALAADVQANRLYSAAGDGCAYAWDMETGQSVMVYDGHSDYLHCIVSRASQNQIITGSEDGAAVIWDCRSGERVAILDPYKAVRVTKRSKDKSPWVSCMALDSSENWLVCGNGGRCVTLWSLPGLDAVTRIATLAVPQAVTITDDQIVTVGAQPHLSRWSFGGNLLSQVKIAPPSALSVSVHSSGTTAIAGYGGLVDIITEFGSHLCTFRCYSTSSL
ncbi:THO complex subunit 6 [Marchantia polymorpha subsp. ruderalis]|uniref:Uncharacterized protein n=2 Tax=Marchantia polymorpha TaxID=3197 RepID=A0AAF6B4K0_MARPO|nr:hypothetical protein MARPO_0100s0025 [Marchantia polymorpha]BBN06934.1 hypothetical protein Mp_3g25120 [Marchantia polymorpha subsp. ruderalis]|eukprot:PTQ32312.1 hypothetical protein MARPO_0100s0025 [Marchantia polymorpha]